ncbi:serine/threonine-protein kinase [Saccharothrix australiensis]|uniref:non-specific serine/threonine protein kinase n=1 Tax=Saccharothrix australiensis TaxID=2072 RepID=A0A495VXX0_9PSEU|nr:serine/threonine-protein kinase [Saccharothrix australiensis]RKT54262.1 serine/threonine-protein kinase [Saccharothrix australiensis]
MSRSLDTDLLAGRYRLLERIGADGTVRAHRAWDVLLRRRVAVKLFEPMTEEAGLRFDREVGALARLSHPGLVTVYDCDVHDGVRFVVLRLVEGRTLRELVDQGPLPPDHVCHLGAGLADALAHVHAHRLVHGEVHASNVLLDDEGAACLADFGLGDSTRAVDPDRSTSGATDVLALGLVLLECLTGHATDPTRRPPAIPEDLPAGLKSLLARMTAPSPRDRPAADACASALTGLASDVTAPRVQAAGADIPAARRPADVPAPRPAVGADTPDRSKRHHSRGTLAASAGVLVGALAITAAMTADLRPAASDPPGTSAPPAAPQATGDARPDEARPQLVGVTRPADVPPPPAASTTAPPAPAEPEAGPSATSAPTTTPTTSAATPTTTAVTTTPGTSSSAPPTTATSSESSASPDVPTPSVDGD